MYSLNLIISQGPVFASVDNPEAKALFARGHILSLVIIEEFNAFDHRRSIVSQKLKYFAGCHTVINYQCNITLNRRIFWKL